MNYKAVIVTEGAFDAQLVQSLLPDLIERPDEVRVLSGSGYSSALATTHTVLYQTSKPTLLLLDADTNDAYRASERRQFAEDYVTRDPAIPFKVVVAVPTLDVLFFSDKSALSEALGRPISDEVWQLAQSNPKQALSMLAGDMKEHIPRLLDNPRMREKMGQNALMREIQHFIQAA